MIKKSYHYVVNPDRPKMARRRCGCEESASDSIYKIKVVNKNCKRHFKKKLMEREQRKQVMKGVTSE